ncbi:unnamed protein product [Schistosoma curassoni]|uniref:Uncharacterized protein n=1 Tax=Schistosoma curassoni TaxID=6186 RepID=A0A183JYF1_9TREM|nr:unnamed protein product [Schistosoma curassoni]
MVVGGSRQETLNPGFVLLRTRQQGVSVILKESVLPGGFDPMSTISTVRDVTTELSGPRPTYCLLNDSYTKSFELLKYTIHMMLIKHIIHKLKQQLHHNKQVTIATNHWILTYRLTQRIYNLLQISNELMNIQIYQNTTDKHLN